MREFLVIAAACLAGGLGALAIVWVTWETPCDRRIVCSAVRRGFRRFRELPGLRQEGGATAASVLRLAVGAACLLMGAAALIFLAGLAFGPGYPVEAPWGI